MEASAGAKTGLASPEEILREALAAAPWLDRDVLARRFGLGTSRQTLEQVGAAHGLHRERVRHIEAKALRSLRLRHGDALSVALGADAPALWRQLVGEHSALAAARHGAAGASLPPWLHLAIAVCASTVVE